MNLELEILRTSYLTNVEVGQLINQHLSDLATIDPNLRTDEPYNSYITDMATKATNYQKGLLQAQKNAETEIIVKADGVRDKSARALGAALKLYALSDNADEVEASRRISILFSPFKKLDTLNYSSETLAIDNLVSDLLSPAYNSYVSILQVDRYIFRLQNANENFKPLFGSRMVTKALTETFDMKLLRTELLKKYSDFAEYVLSMAKVTNSPLFITTLNLLNAARKYYNDQMAQPAKPIVEAHVV